MSKKFLVTIINVLLYIMGYNFYISNVINNMTIPQFLFVLLLVSYIIHTFGIYYNNILSYIPIGIFGLGIYTATQTNNSTHSYIALICTIILILVYAHTRIDVSELLLIMDDDDVEVLRDIAKKNIDGMIDNKEGDDNK